MTSSMVRRLGVLLLISILGLGTALGYGVIPFRAAAPAAPLIVEAKVTRTHDGFADVSVLRVLRGELSAGHLVLTYLGRFNDGQPHSQRPADGRIYLLLLSSSTQFFVEEWYSCGTVNALEVIGERIASPKDFDPSWSKRGDLTMVHVERMLSREQRVR